jgi:acetyl-CoA acetyltransferase
MLEKTGMTLGQIDQVEINEAFAAQTLACQKEWGTQIIPPHPPHVFQIRLSYSKSQSNELTRAPLS